MRRQHGFSLVELMAALLILTLVIMTSLAIFFDHRKHLQRAREQVMLYQALQNESELWRRKAFAGLEKPPLMFESDLSMLGELQPYTTAVAVENTSPDIKKVTLTVRWHQGERV